MSIQDKSTTQMTALCLSASFCFLVCVTPSMVLLIGKPYWNVPPSDWYAIAKSVTNQVWTSHRLLLCVLTIKMKLRTAHTSYCLCWMMMMMMSGFVERVINSPQTCCRSFRQVRLQMSSKRRRGKSCGSQSGW